MEGFFVALFGIGLCFFIGMICIVILSYFSKLFNVRVVTRTGGPIADPRTFDALKELSKETAREIWDKVGNADFLVYKKLKDSSTSKIEKLNQLTNLYEKGILTPDEFTALKKEILS